MHSSPLLLLLEDKIGFQSNYVLIDFTCSPFLHLPFSTADTDLHSTLHHVRDVPSPAYLASRSEAIHHVSLSI